MSVFHGQRSVARPHAPSQTFFFPPLTADRCGDVSIVFCRVQLRMEHLADLRSRVRDEPPPGGNTARIRLQLPNGSKVHTYVLCATTRFCFETANLYHEQVVRADAVSRQFCFCSGCLF